MIFLLFFLYIGLAIRGNDFIIVLSTNKLKIELVERKWTQKWTFLTKLVSVFWQFWGLKKSYSGLFQNVWEKFHNFVFSFLVNAFSY